MAVLTPFYKKTWFIVSSITTVLLIIFGWFRYRTQQLKKRQALLENTVAERTVELKKSADEKTVLLKEIHHRVKNNLEIISSLLELQSATIEDENVLGAVAEGRNRVKSMSLIHQKLYQTDNLASIDMQHYIEDLSRFLYNTFNIKGKEINTVVNAPNISLDVDTAVPIGLILNELISNAYKYAFMEKDAGTINIRLSKLGDDKLELVMSDDGKGLPEDFNVSRSASLGLRLVSILTRQLKGQLTTTSENRTQFQIIFTPKSKVQ